MKSCSQFGRVWNGYLRAFSHSLFCFVLTQGSLVILLNLFERGFRVAFQWVPAYCGIRDNEKADLAAKEGSKRRTISNISSAMCRGDPWVDGAPGKLNVSVPTHMIFKNILRLFVYFILFINFYPVIHFPNIFTESTKLA